MSILHKARIGFRKYWTVSPDGGTSITRPLFILMAALIGGVALAPYTASWLSIVYAGLLTLFILNIVLYLCKRRTLLAPLALFFFLGAVIGQPPNAIKRFSIHTSDRQSAPVSFVGYLTSYPSRYGTERRMVIDLDLQKEEEGWQKARGKLRVTVRNPGQDFAAGERVALLALPRAPRNFNNPGGFDYVGYLAEKGIGATTTVDDDQLIVSLGGKNRMVLTEPFLRLRERLARAFEQQLSPLESGIMQALIVGEKGGLSNEVKELFHSCGVGHLLAISGLHMGIIAFGTYGIILFLLKRSTRLIERTNIFRWALIGSIPPLLFYTAISGMSLSAFRASIMVLAFIQAFLLNRFGDPLGAVALAAIAVIAIEPSSPRDISFQLSFAAVVGILVLAPKLIPSRERMAQGIGAHSLGRVYGWLAITVSAYLVTLPIVAHYFNRVSLVAIFTNVWAVPLVSFWVAPLGLLSAMLFPVLPSAAVVVVNVAALPIPYMIKALEWFKSLPYSSIYVFTPNWIEVTLYFGALFSLFHFRKSFAARVAIVLIVAAGLVDAAYWTTSRMHQDKLIVTFLDVGQGSAALVRFPEGSTMMIDGGGFHRSEFDLGKMVVAPYLWRNKIMSLDYIVNSHPESDHVNGLVFLAQNFKVGEVWTTGVENAHCRYNELMEAASSRNIKCRTVCELKGPLSIDGTTVNIFYPTPEVLSHSRDPALLTPNNTSLVIKIVYGNTSFLFPGDLENKGEAELVSLGHDLGCNVLQSPHHGSNTSSSPPFMAATHPNIVVIPVGHNNWAGQPHREVLELYRELGCRVYRTDENGAVTITSDGKDLSVFPTVSLMSRDRS